MNDIELSKSLVAEQAAETVRLADAIWGYAELAYEEEKSASALIDALKNELDSSIPIQCYHTDSANADIAAFSCVSADPRPDVVFTSSPAFAQKLSKNSVDKNRSVCYTLPR